MQVRIFKPNKSAMQSGLAKTGRWIMEYELPSKREPEPLMGWTASGDTLNQVRLKFDSVGQAIAYAKEKGWGYTVSKAHERKVVPKNYADNFKYIPVEE